ncbi:MAG: PEP-utilizing enzyme [Patescibacteria group bacterium]
MEWVKTGQKGKNVEILTIDLFLTQGFRHFHQRKYRLPGALQATRFRQYNGARWLIQKDISQYLKLVKVGEARDKTYLLKSFQRYERALTQLKKTSDRFTAMRPTSFTNTQIIRLVDSIIRRVVFIVPYVYNYIVLNSILPVRLTDAIARREKDIHRQAEYFEILSSAKELSQFRLSQKLILHIAEIKRHPARASKERVRLLVRKWLRLFGFFGFFYMYGRPFTERDVLARIKDFGVKAIRQELAVIRKQQQFTAYAEKLMNQLHFTASEKALVKTLRQITYCTNTFDETCHYAAWRMHDFWQEVSRRIGVTYDQMNWLLVSEIVGLLRRGSKAGPSMLHSIHMRQNNHVLLWEQGRLSLLIGRQAEYYHRRQPHERINQRQKSLIGQSASPGHVRGTVKVVMSIAELHKVKRGDVLVAASTTPAHVPAMEKAAAIVTDEGGLLCHAAIVSRELRIPCVIGTKIATKVFKDGDRVEVDAIKGIVRKL